MSTKYGIDKRSNKIRFLHITIRGNNIQKFSEYVNNNQKSNNKNSEKINNESAFELLKRVASKYEGASQEDLISAIMTEAKLAKERGTLSTNEIQNFVFLCFGSCLSFLWRPEGAGCC